MTATVTAGQPPLSEDRSGTGRPVSDLIPIRRALVSLSDKDRLADLLEGLSGRGVTIWSTGGTFQEIARRQDRLDYRLEAISDLTGYPEMPGGLVKTLHPKVHAGILAEPFDREQEDYLVAIGAVSFDLVACNLYPFERISREAGVTVERLRQQIDIGGPTMVRAAAKNFLRVAVIVDPTDYAPLAAELARTDGRVSLATRWALARKAFRHVLAYDDAISRTLDGAHLAGAYEPR